MFTTTFTTTCMFTTTFTTTTTTTTIVTTTNNNNQTTNTTTSNKAKHHDHAGVSEPELLAHPHLRGVEDTVNFRTIIIDFRGFDANIILIERGGIPRPIGIFPESLSQAILVGKTLVGKLGVLLIEILLPRIAR